MSSKQSKEEEFVYIVVGGGIAGVSCVEQILALESNANILMISCSPVVKEASCVTKLTKTLEDFVIMERSLKSFRDVHPSVRVLQDDVIKLDSEQQKIETKSGKWFAFKKLCICTGAKPKIEFEGSPYVIGIRDTDSVEKLATRVASAHRILVLGNGGIATEFVYEAKGVEIIWVVKDKSISSHYIDAGAAEFFIQARINQTSSSSSKFQDQDADNPTKLRKRMKYTLSSIPSSEKQDAEDNVPSLNLGSSLGPDWHSDLSLVGLREQKLVTVEYETTLKRILERQDYETHLKETCTCDDLENWKVFCELENGKFYGCDLIISATGVVPNLSWFTGDHEEAKGIFVNSCMLTSLSNVFAAGDVCCPTWEWSKHWFQMRLWTQARQMGLYAGKCMVATFAENNEENVKDNFKTLGDQNLDFCFELFSHVTRFFGFKVVLLGLYNGQGLPADNQHLLLRCTKNLEYIKVVLVDWRMQGAILIGETGLEETFENLILNQVDLSSYGEDLLNPDIDIEDYFD